MKKRQQEENSITGKFIAIKEQINKRKLEKIKRQSMYKNKGKKWKLKNKRGIFFTNNISKTFEEVIMNKTKGNM